MLYLISQIVLCLLAAMIVGFILGWLGNKLFGGSGVSEEEHEALRARLNEARDKSASLEASLKDCNEMQTRNRSELAAANARASDMEALARKAENDARAQIKAATEKSRLMTAKSVPTVKKTVVKKQEPAKLKVVTKKAAPKKKVAKKAAPKKAAPKKAVAKKRVVKKAAPKKAAVKKRVVKKAAPKKAAVRKKVTKKKVAPRKPRVVKKDDLKLISGVGPVIERRLNKIGITTFKQISKFTRADIKRVGESIEFFPDRISRDNWKAQASKLHTKKYGRKP